MPRLTAIKFPASKRPGVYRETPNHEQAEWFGRIGREGDLEAAELAGLLLAASASKTPAWDEKLYPEMTRDFLSETGRRIRRRLSGMVRRPPARREGEEIEAVRLFKGLRPKL